MIYISSALPNLENALAARVVVIETRANGYLFARANPFYNGETFFLTHEALAKSLWIQWDGLNYEI